MQDIHGHEVLHMMEGNSYSEASLRQAIIDRWGEEQRFCTCSASGMDADELIAFLKARGKFRPEQDGFTVDLGSVCKDY